MFDKLRYRIMNSRLDEGKTITKIERILNDRIPLSPRESHTPILSKKDKPMWSHYLNLKPDYVLRPACYRVDKSTQYIPIMKDNKEATVKKVIRQGGFPPEKGPYPEAKMAEKLFL